MVLKKIAHVRCANIKKNKKMDIYAQIKKSLKEIAGQSKQVIHVLHSRRT
jgi:hypothetical protein